MKTWVEKLIPEYAASTKPLEIYRRSLNQKDPNQKDESETVGGMISDLKFALSWMRRGRRPGSLRGIDRQKVYHRTATVELLEPEEELELLDILLSMSIRERQCYLLHFSQGLTQNEIADILKLSRGAVQTFLKRAKRKVQQGFTD